METFRKALKTRIVLLMLLAAVTVALGIYDVFFAGADMRESIIFEFQCGVTTALGLMSVCLIVRFRSILGNDTKLQQQFNRENDERLKAIRAKAGMPMLLITSAGMLLAAIIAGYYDITVFITLVAAALLQVLAGAIVKLVYLKRM